VITISKWYHTGDDDIDDFIDRNRDLFEYAIFMYGERALREAFKRRSGLMLSTAGLFAIAGRLGSDIVGFYLAGILDPDEGRANWNEYQARIYDWYGLEDYRFAGIGIDLLPNPIGLAGVVAESLVNMHDYVAPLFEHSINIGFSHLTSWILPSSTLDVRELVRSSIPDHPWNAEPGWRHR